MSFLDSFSAGARQKVYMSITPGVGLELIQLDVKGKSVANYAVRELAYNETSRDIADYDYFKTATLELFEELGVNPKCDVVLNVPLVVFGSMQLGLLLPNEAITGAVQSEVEQTYIFRRLEPIVAWQDIPTLSNNPTTGKETRPVLYTAIQKTVVDCLKASLAELGANLVRIETSMTSTLRALDFMDVVTDQMQPNATWNLMIINSVGYSLISMVGKNVVDYYEEPLATKSFEGDEIYNAIAQSAQITLMSYPANHLFIVSDTDQVSAELLVSRLTVSSSVSVLDNNSFKRQDSLIPVSLNVLQSYASKISLQAIGCALSDVSEFPLKFDFFSNSSEQVGELTCVVTIGEHDVVVSKSMALKIAGVLATIAIIVFALIGYVLLPQVVSATREKASKVSQDLETINKQIESMSTQTPTDTFDVKTSVENGIKNNRSKLMNYVAIGDAIPKNVWLTYFVTQGNGQLDVKGVSSDVNDIYVFFKNLRDSLLGTQLKLQKLDMEATSLDAAISGTAPVKYEFEITNMTVDQLSSLSGNKTNGEGGANPNPAAAQANQNTPGSGSTMPQADPTTPNTSGGEKPPSNGLLGTEPIKK